MPHWRLSWLRWCHVVWMMMKSLIQARSRIINLIQLIQRRESWLMSIEVCNRTTLHWWIAWWSTRVSVATDIDIFVHSATLSRSFLCKIWNASSQSTVIRIVWNVWKVSKLSELFSYDFLPYFLRFFPLSVFPPDRSLTRVSASISS